MFEEQPLNPAIPSRRRLLAGLSAGALIATLPACSENPATGRRQFTLVSDEMLARLSEQAWNDALAQTPRLEGARVQRRLERIGQRIVDASGLSHLNWRFVAFDSPEINAFVLPGGQVGFFRGLLELAAGDGEVAAVMGHEVGHVAARHAAERMSQQLAVQAGVQIAQLVLQEDLGEYADEAAAALGMGLIYGVVLPYSRTHELEADRLGVSLMREADYAPRDALEFWRRMIAASEGRTAPLPWLSTHPANEDRLAALAALAAA